MKETIKGVTCFSTHKECNSRCDNKACRLWIDLPDSLNCTVIESAKGPKTLQEVGEIFNITRMRVCQIEKKILGKLKDLHSLSNSYPIQ
ncbi:hypothetical protein OAA09_00230 [bacterium]|nr:hypothetical protein [bacterium]